MEKKLKKLYSLFLNTSNLLNNQSIDSELTENEKAIIGLIAALIKADGVISPEEIHTATLFFKKYSPVDRANKLVSHLESQLKESRDISISDAGNILSESLNLSAKEELLSSIILYAAEQKELEDRKQLLLQIGTSIGLSEEQSLQILEKTHQVTEQSKKYGKIGAIISVSSILIGLVLLAGFLRPIFLGLALAYLMDPVLSFFERKTRYSRKTIVIGSIFFIVISSVLILTRVVAAINYEEIKTFTVNAPHQIWGNLEKFRDHLKEKKTPENLIQPLDQLLYGSINFYTEDIFEEDSLDKNQRINEILTTDYSQIKKPLVSVFPEAKMILEKNSFHKVEQFVNFTNEIINLPEKQLKFYRNLTDEYMNTNHIPTLSKIIDEKAMEIQTRQILSDIFSLNSYQPTSEKIAQHIKSLFIQDSIKYGKLAGGIIDRIKKAIGLLLDILLAIGFYYFFAKEFYHIGNTIMGAVPIPYRYNTDQIFRKINWIFEGFLRGQFILILIESIVYSTIFSFIGLPYALLIGVISGFAVIIPYLGLIISFILAFIAALSGGIPLWDALIYLSFIYGVMNLIENFYLAPKLVGDRVGLNDLETLIAIVAGGSLGGVIGIILAIPGFAIAKVFLSMLFERYKESDFYQMNIRTNENKTKTSK